MGWLVKESELKTKETNEKVPTFMKGSMDPFPWGRISFLGGINILRSELGPLGHHVQHKMCQKVSLVKRIRKNLEKSVAEFTQYLNISVCLHQRKLSS